MNAYRPPRREEPMARPTREHIPFPGHRTQKEVREDQGKDAPRRRNRHKLGRVCSKCPAPISDASKTGLCKPCFMRSVNADPDVKKRRGETLQRTLRTDKAAYARKCAILAAGRASRFPEKLQATGRALQQRRTPEIETKRIAALVASNKRRRHAWLPDEWRPTYFKMIRNCGYRAPQAKRIILAQIRTEQRRHGCTTPEANGSRRLAEAIRKAQV